MKKIIILFLTLSMLFSLVSCNSANKKSDETALPFIKALLVRDEAEMGNYLHPDYKESAMPNDNFYTQLSYEHFFTLGNELTAMNAVEKNYINDTDFDGELMECIYLIRTNELLYDVKLLILENDNGYGIVAVSIKLSSNIEYLAVSSEE